MFPVVKRRECGDDFGFVMRNATFLLLCAKGPLLLCVGEVVITLFWIDAGNKKKELYTMTVHRWFPAEAFVKLPLSWPGEPPPLVKSCSILLSHHWQLTSGLWLGRSTAWESLVAATWPVRLNPRSSWGRTGSRRMVTAAKQPDPAAWHNKQKRGNAERKCNLYNI